MFATITNESVVRDIPYFSGADMLFEKSQDALPAIL